jgi:acyl dehydratase
VNTQTAGPGKITTTEVGCYTISTTVLMDARRIMAYAAGINDTNEAYFDDTRAGGLNVHPAICFALQWNSRFQIDQPVNKRAAPFGVHAESDLRIHQPFKQGEAVTTQGRLVSRKQIRPGVFSVERYRMTNSKGELLAELDYNGITRGGVLVGDDVEVEPSPTWPSPVELSDTPIWTEEVSIPLHAGQQYTECANIYNPIHTEPSIALAAGLPNVILHGSATKAHALTAVVNRCFDGDAKRITRLCGQLRGMVLMDSTISVQCLGINKENDETQVFFRVLNAAGELAISNGVVVGR